MEWRVELDAEPTRPRPVDGVSFVSVGDGSVNNAHFLAARNRECTLEDHVGRG